METKKKLKEKLLHEMETQNCESTSEFCPKDPTDSSPPKKKKKKKKKKKRDIMQLESPKKGSSVKHKNLKSKDKKTADSHHAFDHVHCAQNCDSTSEFCPKDPTDSPTMKKKKKRDIMQLESPKKGSSVKPKSLKSKDKKVCSDKSKKSGSNTRKRTRYTDIYDDVEAKFSVMERAERVLARLENELPHFVKCMLPSNVAHGFWLHLPRKFCNIHLPNHDTSIVLVDEWGNGYKTSYLLGRHGLSAGWRGFSISHRLLKGDILIFHLTEPCKLKVHIVRVNGADVVDAALCLMNFDPSGGGGADADLAKKHNRKSKKTKYVEPFLPHTSTPPENVKGKNISADQSASNSDCFSSEVIEGTEVSNRLPPYPETSFLHDQSREGVVCR